MRHGIFFHMTALAGAVFFLIGPAWALPPQGDFVDLVKRLSPTVVDISARQGQASPAGQKDGAPSIEGVPKDSPLRPFFDDLLKKRIPKRNNTPSLGSGFIIDKAGIIVTNNHVLGEPDGIRIGLKDGRKFEAEIVGRDPYSDIAVLQIKTKEKLNLPVVKFGDPEKTEVGEWVFAIGTPFGLRGTVTAGIVSAINRDIGAGSYDDFIQTDAAINRGNSGGPLFNTRGEVIGINTVILSPSGGSVGASFAISISTAMPIINQLRRDGETSRGWLGVAIQDVTEELAETLRLKDTQGALVSSVSEGSPADKAGIKEGDVIIKFNGAQISKMRELPRIVSRSKIGSRALVEVIRSGQRRRLYVVLGRLEDARKQGKLQGQKRVPPPQIKSDKSALGMDLARLTPEYRRRFNIPENIEGILIVGVKSDSAAFEAGLRGSQVILEVARNKVKTPDDVVRGIRAEQRRRRKAVLLRIWQNGGIRFIALPIGIDEIDDKK